MKFSLAIPGATVRLSWSEVKWKSLSHVRLFATPWTILSWNSPGRNTGVGSLSLLQRIYPTQGSNPGLPHCGWSLYQLSHKGNPRILEWVACPFSSGSSWLRNWTGVSCIAGGFSTNWAMRDAYFNGGTVHLVQSILLFLILLKLHI